MEGKKEYYDETIKGITGRCYRRCFDRSSLRADQTCLNSCYSKSLHLSLLVFDALKDEAIDRNTEHALRLFENPSKFKDIVHSGESLDYYSYEYPYNIEFDRMSSKSK